VAYSSSHLDGAESEKIVPAGHTLFSNEAAVLEIKRILEENLARKPVGSVEAELHYLNGRPFFVVSCAVDPGLLSVLREHIVPRLKADVPNQPTEEQLEAKPLLSRFTIVFDREGYSPAFFAQMKQERIAVLTYHKFPGELWPEQEFRLHQVSLVNGEQVTMELAERGVQLSNALWVREVRHRSEKGHQSSILREVLQLWRRDLVGWFDAPPHAFGFGSFQVAAIRAGGHSLGRGLVPAFFTFIP